MTRRRTPSAATLARKVGELALAAPQVIAHRSARMALAGATPSARDRREFHRMGAEKSAAFQESWLAMWAQGWQVQQRMAMQFMQAMWTPWWLGGGRSAGMSPARMQQAMLGVLGKGLAPVHRRATANARRLGATRLR